MQPAQITTYELIQKIISDDYQEVFINYFFDCYCRSVCGVDCNEHYTEGPEIKDILGCCILHFKDEEKLRRILKKIIDRADNNYDWQQGWKKNKLT